NARLEEVSFRTGVRVGAVALLVLAAATAAVVLTVMPGQGAPVNRAAVAPAATSAPAVAAVTPAAASASPSAPSAPAAGAQPAAQAGQTSQDTGASPQETATGRTSWQAGQGGHWHGRPIGAWAPRHGRARVFTGGPWRPAPRGLAGR